MNRCLKVVSILSIMAIFAGIPALRANWQPNGTIVCNAAGDQYEALVINDGAGGIITAWLDDRGSDADIYARRVDGYGNALWTVDGVPVCTAAGWQNNMKIVSDGAGSAIIAWLDQRIPIEAIFAQRIDSTGAAMWTADGDTVFTEINSIDEFNMISDGAGGAIVVWMDNRHGEYDLFAQRIDGNGTRLWAHTGVPVCTYAGTQRDMEIIAAGGGEFIIVWTDDRAINDDIYAQKIDMTGALLWNSDGVAVCADPDAQDSPVLATDGAGGAIIAWNDGRGGDGEVYGQRIHSAGWTLWAVDGISLVSGPGDRTMPQIITDGTGGAIFVFMSFDGMYVKVLAQRIDGSGIPQWWEEGVMVCPGEWETYSEFIASDGAGGAIIGFADMRDDSYVKLYAQRLDHTGEPLWKYYSVLLYEEDAEPDWLALVGDGAGGAFFVWPDDRNGDYDVFALRINAYGGIGEFYSPPLITSAADVPNDQGGKLTLMWNASPADTLPDSNIEYYSAWRLLPGLGESAGTTIGELEQLGMEENFSGDAVRWINTAAGDAWEWLANIPARQSEEYALMIESLYDSMGSDPGWQYFVVTAHSADPAIYFDSPVDSGYSVDNLSPALPLAFGGIQSLAPPGLHLYWELGTEPDLSHYEVYKGATEDFVPDESNFVGSAADSILLDTGWTPADEDFFKLVAVDVHGNKGPDALLKPENIYVGTLLQSFHASWTDSWIELAWTVSEAGDGLEFHATRAESPGGEFTEITGYSLEKNGMSFLLKDHSCEPGVTYVYRVEVNDGDGLRVLFETEEIEAPEMPLTLFQNVPNPFNPSTSIAFYLPERSNVRIDIYDVAGRLVTTLVEGTRLGGRHTVEWNGSDVSGRTAASGVYFYRLVAGKFVQTRKMILLR